MSTKLFPIIANTPADPMELCATCPDPGHCCKEFLLLKQGKKGWYSRKNWKRDSLRAIRRVGLPFDPLRIVEEKKGKVLVSFNCSWLSSKGRCRAYSKRPQLCRDFVPMSDDLCIIPKEKAA